MRKLTLKDFITFYTPCLSCGEKNSVFWIVNYKNPKTYVFVSEFPININGKNLEIDLKKSYYNKFSLIIDMSTHAYISSDSSEFLKYIGECTYHLCVRCTKCNSVVFTSNLDFNLKKNMLNPLTIKNEQWHITDDEHIYAIYTSLENDETELIVDKINAVKPLTPWQKKIEAMPINRFYSKEDFLERIRTYMVFS